MRRKDVGYCSPPVANQFKKGISGNPGGRPKSILSEKFEIFDRVLRRRIGPPGKAGKRSIELLDAMVDVVVLDAVRGDLNAILYVIKLWSDPEYIRESVVVRITGGFRAAIERAKKLRQSDENK